MARPKSVKSKVLEVKEVLEKQIERATVTEKKELTDVLNEIEDVLSAPDLSEDQKRNIIGYNLETGAPIFLPN